MAYRWRNWAYESAGLDLALAQAGRASTKCSSSSRARSPSSTPSASAIRPPPTRSCAGSSATPTCVSPRPALQGRRGRLMDSGDRRGFRRHRVRPYDRLQWPVRSDHTAADLDTVPLPARTFNIKPGRVGRLRDLFELYAECDAAASHLRRRHGRARRRARPDPAARLALSPRRSQRHRAARRQRARPGARSTNQPASASTGADRLPAGRLTVSAPSSRACPRARRRRRRRPCASRSAPAAGR